MPEAKSRYLRNARGFDTVVTAATPESWDTPTPCSEWKASDIVTHIVGNHRRLESTVRGGEPQPVGDNEDPGEVWRASYGAMLGIVDDPAAMATVIDGPTGKMPFEQVLGSFVSMDLLVHTWDLARAVGADEHLDEASVAEAFEMMKPMDEMIRRPGIFGPKLETPSGADLQTEFLHFLGRKA